MARNFDEVILSPNKMLYQYKKEFGEEVLLAIIVKAMISLVKSFNVGKTMNAEQVMNTSKQIIEDYPNFRLDDFKLFFENCKKGYYGTSYDRIDQAVIYTWLAQYAADRGERLGELKRNEAKDKWKQPAPALLLDVLKSVHEEIRLEKEAKKKQQQEKKQTPNIIRTWMQRFDELWEKGDGIHPSGIKYISRNGEGMTIQDYLNYRLDNYNKKLS